MNHNTSKSTLEETTDLMFYSAACTTIQGEKHVHPRKTEQKILTLRSMSLNVVLTKKFIDKLCAIALNVL